MHRTIIAPLWYLLRGTIFHPRFHLFSFYPCKNMDFHKNPRSTRRALPKNNIDPKDCFLHLLQSATSPDCYRKVSLESPLFQLSSKRVSSAGERKSVVMLSVFAWTPPTPCDDGGGDGDDDEGVGGGLSHGDLASHQLISGELFAAAINATPSICSTDTPISRDAASRKMNV